MCRPRNTSVIKERLRCRPVVRKRGHVADCTRSAERMPSTTEALSRTSVTAPAPRVVYHRRVSFTRHHRDPPETATGVPDEEVVGVVEDCKPDGVKVEALELEVAALDGVVVVPGFE